MADELSASLAINFSVDNIEFEKVMAKYFDKSNGDFEGKVEDLTTTEEQLDPNPLSGDSIYLIINTGAANVYVGIYDTSYRWFSTLKPGEFCLFPSYGDLPPYVKSASASTVEWHAFVK